MDVDALVASSTSGVVLVVELDVVEVEVVALLGELLGMVVAVVVALLTLLVEEADAPLEEAVDELEEAKDVSPAVALLVGSRVRDVVADADDVNNAEDVEQSTLS